MGPHEPYWQTNTSFSPPPSRWDLRNHSEGQSFDSHDGNQLYGSSTSSNGRESRSWFRGTYLPDHRHTVSEGVGIFTASPDFSPAQPCTTSAIQEISDDDFGKSSRRVLRPLSFSANIEEGSVSSRSDSTDTDIIAKSQSSNRNFSTRRCFMSKPVHPMSSCPPRFANSDETHHRCDFDSTELFEPTVKPSYVYKCGLCERLLSQRSPWSSLNGDMPVTGVLSCRHVFHADCLDQITPKVRKNDPLCPVCAKSATCIEGPMNAPSTNTMLVFNRNRVSRSISLRS